MYTLSFELTEFCMKYASSILLTCSLPMTLISYLPKTGKKWIFSFLNVL